MKEGNGVFCNFAKQTKRQGTWRNNKRVGWIGEEKKAQFTSYSEMDMDGQMIDIEQEKS